MNFFMHNKYFFPLSEIEPKLCESFYSLYIFSNHLFHLGLDSAAYSEMLISQQDAAKLPWNVPH